MKALIYISLREEVPDNSGKLIAEKLCEQGFSEVINAKVGKMIELELDGASGVETQRRLESMCSLLLADTAIEYYQVIKIIEER